MAALRRILPTAVAIVAGIFVLLSVFTSSFSFVAIGTYFIDTAVVIAAFALILGVINVLRVHGRRIHEGGSGRFYSFVLIAAMFVVLALGMPALPDRPYGPSQPAVQWIFENIQAPIQASLSGLLVFFVITAAYRLLRARNLESAVMLIVTIIVLLGQVTVGLVPILPKLKDWILDVPAMAGVRGILLGVALGALLTGIRLLVGAERPYSD
jgi:hypothetical protein